MAQFKNVTTFEHKSLYEHRIVVSQRRTNITCEVRLCVKI